MTSQARRSWIGARCEYCSAEWTAESTGAPLRYSAVDDAIVCNRGRGCARRRPEHEREVRNRSGVLLRREYQHEGHWYTTGELSALAEATRQRVERRLAEGWTIEDTLRVEVYPKNGRPRDTALHAALARAGGSVQMPSRKGEPNRPDERRAAAAALGLTESGLCSRIKRLGSLEAALAAGATRPTEVYPWDEIATATGISREGLYKRAKVRGIALAEVIADALANPGKRTRSAAPKPTKPARAPRIVRAPQPAGRPPTVYEIRGERATRDQWCERAGITRRWLWRLTTRGLDPVAELARRIEARERREVAA